ncbi:hypothetical protein OE88DRAFT_1650266 [Heliocybe sulcata]|uniref:F-box domain-containing protein n=1 Tax=Heliocybe sulcata TaxID=5364 RepID=A0A5C3NIP6_9AGAM|nr:hypothetical protein OE88DRAFT_1650266 [Heliocybe sulcata]
MASLQLLPPELYTAILAHIPDFDLRKAIISLARAIPRSPVPQDLLFHSVTLTHPDQITQLSRCLESCPERSLCVRECIFEADTRDADAVVKLARSMANLTCLKLVVTLPYFPPVLLDELLRGPWVKLNTVGLHFKFPVRGNNHEPPKIPCFDAVLEALCGLESLRILSIVQDPIERAGPAPQSWATGLPRTNSGRTSSSNPLVFDANDPFASNIVQPLFTPPASFAFSLDNPFVPNPAEPYPFNSPAHKPLCVFNSLTPLSQTLPALRFLRLRLPSLSVAKQVYAPTSVLDRIELLDLSACIVKDYDVKRILGRFANLCHLVLDNTGVLRGEFGRAEWRQLGKDCALAGLRKAREREAKVKEWLDMGGRAAILPGESVPGEIREIRILPRAPTLLSLCATMLNYVPGVWFTVRQEFEIGWWAGMAELVAITAALKTSFTSGMKVVKFAANMNGPEDDEGINGLQDVDMADFEVDVAGRICPVLCLAGPGRRNSHTPGCGHRAGWEVWKDDL